MTGAARGEAVPVGSDGAATIAGDGVAGTIVGDAAAITACLDCDAPLTGAYCSRCGQPAADRGESVRALLGQDFAELLAWDSRLARTLQRLALDPAGLVRDWIAGRRQRYVRPVRLYLAVSAVFLFVFGLLHPFRDPSYYEPQVAALERVFGAVTADRALFTERFIAWYNTIVPFVIALTALATALVLKVLWRRVSLHDHLVFVVYLYSFWLITGLVLRLLSPLLGDALLVARYAFLAGVLLYAGSAIRGLYRDRWWLWTAKYAAFVLAFLLIYGTAGWVAESAAFLLVR